MGLHVKVLVLHRAREQLDVQLAALRASRPINGSSPPGRDAPLDPAAASDPAPIGPEERCGASAQLTERTQLRQRRLVSHVPV